MCTRRARAPKSLEAFLKGTRFCSYGVISVGLMDPPGSRQHDGREPVVLVQRYLRDVVVRWSRIWSGQRPHHGRYIKNLIDIIFLARIL